MPPKFKIFFSKVFKAKLARTEKVFQQWVEKVLNQLRENPYVGKPLGAKWFREKKFGKYRVYYLIYQEVVCVFLVDLSDKKDPQRAINSARLLLQEYKTEIYQLSRDFKERV